MRVVVNDTWIEACAFLVISLRFQDHPTSIRNSEMTIPFITKQVNAKYWITCQGTHIEGSVGGKGNASLNSCLEDGSYSICRH